MPKRDALPPGWYTNNIAAQQRPEVRKKVGRGISLAFQKKSPAEKELINARKAVAYRIASAERHAIYHGNHATHAWIAVAEERLKKAEAAQTPDAPSAKAKRVSPAKQPKSRKP